MYPNTADEDEIIHCVVCQILLSLSVSYANISPWKVSFIICFTIKLIIHVDMAKCMEIILKIY